TKRMPAVFSKMVSGHAAEVDLPTPQKRIDLPPEERTMPPIRGEVYMLEGCAMKVLYPRVHQATRRLLRRIGYTVKEVGQGCCGAM
ncbi:heterodisulfide reductase-related iron-sulfur binding cluster, partial [Vibrio parahaemolyticus]